MSVYFDPIRTAILFFPFVALFLLPVFAIFHYRKFGHVNSYRAFLFYSFVLYTMCAYGLVILPMPELTADYLEIYGGTHRPQLQLFTFITDIKGAFPKPEHGWNITTLAKALLRDMPLLQAFFNFLLLLPLGFYLRQLYHLKISRVAVIGFLATLFFELSQYTGLFGLYPAPYRLFDVDDLLLNSLGCVAGYYLTPILFFLPETERFHRAEEKKISLIRRSAALLIDLTLPSVLIALFAAGLGLSIHGTPSWLLDLLTVVVWFVLIPSLWKGFTVGKKLLGLQMVDSSGNPATPIQLMSRTGVLILIPTVVNTLARPTPDADGYTSGVAALGYLALVLLEVVFLCGFIVVNSHRRGPHEIVSGTHLRSRIAAQTGVSSSKES